VDVPRKLLLAATLAMAIAGGGCATAINTQDAAMRKPFGGVTMPLADFFGGDQTSDNVSLLFWPIWLVDKPFSLVGDMLTLPYTLWVQWDTGLPRTGQSTDPESWGSSSSPSSRWTMDPCRP
jgi:uncharacterized protein YceK